MLETHPFPPYLPPSAKVLIMGTFPPQPHRWAMEFYYPNRTNDFWRIIGLLIYGDKDHLYDTSTRTFRLTLIRETLDRCGIALHDTGREVRRLKDNASDKYLEIVTPVPLFELLGEIPSCHTMATTSTTPPAMGKSVHDTVNGLDIWRMPSTSRAYPLPLEQKADYYATLLRSVAII